MITAWQKHAICACVFMFTLCLNISNSRIYQLFFPVINCCIQQCCKHKILLQGCELFGDAHIQSFVFFLLSCKNIIYSSGSRGNWQLISFSTVLIVSNQTCLGDLPQCIMKYQLIVKTWQLFLQTVFCCSAVTPCSVGTW